jgi:hypothetical protein
LRVMEITRPPNAAIDRRIAATKEGFISGASTVRGRGDLPGSPFGPLLTFQEGGNSITLLHHAISFPLGCEGVSGGSYRSKRRCACRTTRSRWRGQ